MRTKPFQLNAEHRGNTMKNNKTKLHKVRVGAHTHSVRHHALVIALAAIYSAGPYAYSSAYADDMRYDGLAANVITGVNSGDLSPQTPRTNPGAQQALGVFNGASQGGQVDYSVNAAVGKIEVEVDKDGLPADGQSASEITVRLFDSKGQQLSTQAYITVEINGGRILLPGANTDELGPEGNDLDRVTPGTQIKVADGVAIFKLLAPSEPQDVDMRITAGKVTAAGKVSFLPELREMLAVGLVEGIISKRTISAGDLSPARQSDGFEQEIQRWSKQFNNGKANASARTAFFIKGKIKGDLLLTAAYDSDKQTRARILRDIRPDEFYPVYGDSAIHGFDARSSDRLYVRVDKDKSYVLYGDFATGSGFSQKTGGGNVAALQLRNLGNYNRTATGVRAHFEEGRLLGNAFVTRDSLKQVIEEYPGNGTSGPFAVRNNSALENSEKVEILIRDKNQMNVIKQVVTLSRFQDYVFEPFSGRILLKSPLLALNAEGDRQSLRITYEVDQGGPEFWVGGVDGQVKVNDHVEVGGSWVDDRNPLSPYRLQSMNAGIKLGESTMIVAEAARSESTQYQTGINLFATPTGQAGETRLNDSGNAYRIEMLSTGEAWNAKAWWAMSESEFDNNATGYTHGKGEAGVKGDYKFNDMFTLFGEAIRSEDRLIDAARTGEKVGVTTKINPRLEFDVFARHVREDSTMAPTALVGSNSAALGGSLGATGGFYGLGVDQNGLASTGIASTGPGLSQNLDASTLGVAARYKATDKLNLDAGAEAGEEDRRRVVLGSQYQIAERTRLYARAETQTGLASAYSLNSADHSTSFSAGIDTSYMEGGSLFSEYRLRDAMSGQQASLSDMQLANGVRNTWNLKEGVAATTGVEYLNVIKGSSQNALAITGGIDYTANPLWKSSGRLEYRRLFDDKLLTGNQSQSQWLNTLSLARKLDRDWTLLTRNYLLVTQNNEDSQGLSKGNTLQDRYQIGMAWRPVDNNKVNGLARYEYKMVRDKSQADGENYRTHIVSAHADYHPSRPWWFTGRLAAKLSKDLALPSDQTYNAFLLGGRAVYDFAEKWDVGFMSSVLYSPQGSAKQWASGLELGYQLKQNLWASMGYNWAGFTDRDLSGSDYTSDGVYVRLRFKFDENLFSSNKPDENRALNRESNNI